MKDFIVDDDFLSKEDQENIKQEILLKSSWRFLQQTNTPSKDGGSLPSDFESFQFVSDQPGGVSDNGGPSQMMQLLIQKFFDKHNLNIQEVIRVKSNILTKASNNHYHSPHIDVNIPHLVLLYYVNNSDGDTIFFDKTYSSENVINKNDLMIQDRISPLQGRAILFNGLKYHASSSPINSDMRCVINFCFIPESFDILQ